MVFLKRKRTLLEIKNVDFKKRYFKSLSKPWFYILIAVMIYLSYQISFFWPIAFLTIMVFILMNLNAQKILITKIMASKNYVELEYFVFNKFQKLNIPFKQFRIEYIGNSIGLTSMVSNHIKIIHKERTLLKQYKNEQWTLLLMEEVVDKLKKQNKEISNI